MGARKTTKLIRAEIREASKIKAPKIKVLVYQSYLFFLCPGVYEPSDETFFLAENMDVRSGERVLDIGTGTGVLAILASKKAKEVVVTDIEEAALRCAEINSRINRRFNISFVRADLFPPKGGRFDVIVANLPTFPAPPSSLTGDYVGKFVDGGRDGRKYLDKVIRLAPSYLTERGRIQLAQSHVADVEKTMRSFKNMGLKPEIRASKIEPFGRTGRERISYFKKIGIPITYRRGIPLERVCIITARMGT